MSDILKKTKQFVVNLLTNQLDSNYRYHNLKHTQLVVKSTKELLNRYQLQELEKHALLLAAWLHDTGYTQGSEEHEKSSCAIARKYLTEQGVDDAVIKKVESYIMATKRYYKPSSLPEEILRDADCSYFGKNSYWETAEQLKEELDLLGIASYSNQEWLEANIDMFQSEHTFYTDYAKENWQPVKEKNLNKLMKK